MTGGASRLDGRVALVTGAGSGIGAACVETLAEAGATVVLTELPDRIALARELAAGLDNAHAIELDVRDVTSIERAVGEAAALRGHLDLLVNNAGIAIRKPALELTPEDWDAVLAVNLRGVFFVAQAVGRVMRDQSPQGGAIVNVASIMGLVGSHERAAYGASKGGVVNLTRVLAIEWAPLQIRVNAVCPTFVDTPLTRPMFEARPDYYAEVLAATPLGRLATGREVAEAVVFLATAPMTTGHALTVDGGWVAR
ncbi:MAG: SDR family oxidoreductase [Gaiellales bacterium]